MLVICQDRSCILVNEWNILRLKVKPQKSAGAELCFDGGFFPDETIAKFDRVGDAERALNDIVHGFAGGKRACNILKKYPPFN